MPIVCSRRAWTALLAAVPVLRALPVDLRGLAEKSQDLRHGSAAVVSAAAPDRPQSDTLPEEIDNI